MSFAGKLADFPLSEMFQVIAGSGETGKLRLTRADAEGIVVFRHGKIIYAASSSARQTLGNLLLCDGLVAEDALNEALDSQVESREEQRLGTILLTMGAIDEDTLKNVVKRQTEKVIGEFMAWDSGYFKLDQIELSDYGEIEVDAEDFLMREGLHTESLLSELESKLEELKQPDADNATTESRTETDTPRSLATLKSLMGEIRGPEFTGEITQKILAYAREILGRGALFVVRPDGFAVMGQFGVDSDNGEAEEALREFFIPKTEQSILADSIVRREPIVGPLEANLWNQTMLSAMGGPPPGDSVAVPLTVNDKVLLVLYADHLTDGIGPGWLEELELLMLQAGLAMEKDLLTKRIEHYENLRRN